MEQLEHKVNNLDNPIVHWRIIHFASTERIIPQDIKDLKFCEAENQTRRDKILS